MTAISQTEAVEFIAMRDYLSGLVKTNYASKEDADKVAEKLIKAGLIDLYALNDATHAPKPTRGRKNEDAGDG